VNRGCPSVNERSLEILITVSLMNLNLGYVIIKGGGWDGQPEGGHVFYAVFNEAGIILLLFASAIFK